MGARGLRGKALQNGWGEKEGGVVGGKWGSLCGECGKADARKQG